MNADQRALFEAWAKSRNIDVSMANRPPAATWFARDLADCWQACLAANAIDQPADDERERLREACILLIDTCEALAGQQAMPDDSWRKAVEEAIAALAKREERA